MKIEDYLESIYRLKKLRPGAHNTLRLYRSSIRNLEKSLGRKAQLEDLTDAQKEQIRALAQEGRQGGDPGAGVRTAEQKLQAAVLANSPDLQAIETLKTALVTAQAAELDHRVGMMQKVAQILTPAQRQQLLEKQTAGPRGRGRHHSPSH